MNRDKILILGGGFLTKAFKRHGYQNLMNRSEFDYPNNIGKLDLQIKCKLYDTIINTIGISDTRFCEDDANWNIIHEVNGRLPNYLSRMCGENNLKFVQISTGCLYDTLDIPQSEDEKRSAHCNYVISKWIGEIGCDNDRDLIIRPRLLFDSERPEEGKRNNLLCKMEKFSSFIDEHNSITSNDTIVEAIEALLENNQSGIFNVAQLGSYTIADIAEYLGLNVQERISQEELRKREGLSLVNNVMDLNKLRRFYEPRDTLVEVERCWKILQQNT